MLYDEDIITYCDICKCEDCPRCGDDCDGEWDEDEEQEDQICQHSMEQ